MEISQIGKIIFLGDYRDNWNPAELDLFQRQLKIEAEQI